MHLRIALGMAALTVSATAPAMPVSTFLAKAASLKSKGPFALFSGDLKLLTNQVKDDFAQLIAERKAAQAAKRPAAFCPPGNSIKLTDKDIIAAMEAVRPNARASTDTRDALRADMTRRFPCPR
jgi:hypothetical protein